MIDQQLKKHGEAFSPKLREGAVTADKIENGAVTTDKIADGAVTTDKIPLKAVTNAVIADEAIDSSKILDMSVTESKLAMNSVTANQIKDGSVYASALADISVVEAKIADNAVTNAKLANDAVTTDKIKDGTVTAEKLADGAAKIPFGICTSAQEETAKTVGLPSGFRLKDGAMFAVRFKNGHKRGTTFTLSVNSASAKNVLLNGVDTFNSYDRIEMNQTVLFSYDSQQDSYVCVTPNNVDYANVANNVVDSISLKGTPTAPTAAVTSNDTQIATTAFVKNVMNNSSYSLTNKLTDETAQMDYAGSNIYRVPPRYISNMPTTSCVYVFTRDEYGYDNGNSNIDCFTFDMKTGKRYIQNVPEGFNASTINKGLWKEI